MPAEARTPPPRPRTPAQIEAARRNGARSRGPVTAAGKARSAGNALRHGLYSARALTPGEDPAAFEALLAALRAEHAPRDVTEHLLVERLALTFWKLARCDRLEAQLATIEPRCPTGRLFPEPGLPRLLSRVPELTTLLRHQAQLERQLHRLLRLLAERRRPAVEPEAAEAADAGSEPSCDQNEESRRNEPEPAVPDGDGTADRSPTSSGSGPYAAPGRSPAADGPIDRDVAAGPLAPDPAGARADHPDLSLSWSRPDATIQPGWPGRAGP